LVKHLTNYIVFLSNITALLLGAWWAAQEGSWGGWWDWDSSETLGLLILLSAVSVFHYKIKLNNFINNSFSHLLFFFFTLVVYFFIQLNFDVVSHNFGTKFFYFFNNSLFLLENIYLFSFIFFFILHQRLLRINNLSTLYIKSPRQALSLYKHTYLIVIFYFFLKTLIISFNFLLNYFLWTFLHTNSLNFFKVFDSDLVLLSITFYFFFKIYILKIFKILSILFWNLTFTLFFFITFRPKAIFALTHFLVFSFLSIIVYSKTIFISDCDNGMFWFNNISGNFSIPLNNSAILNAIFVEHVSYTLTNGFYHIKWILYNFVNHFSSLIFLLIFSNNNTTALFFLNIDKNFTFLVSETIFECALFLHFWLLLFSINGFFIHPFTTFK
jgi:hypothetical protein